MRGGGKAPKRSKVMRPYKDPGRNQKRTYFIIGILQIIPVSDESITRLKNAFTSSKEKLSCFTVELKLRGVGHFFSFVLAPLIFLQGKPKAYIYIYCSVIQGSKQCELYFNCPIWS